MKRRIRKLLIPTVAAAMLVPAFVTLQPKVSSAAPDMATSTVINGSTVELLARNVAQAMKPVANGHVYVAPAGNSVALVQAAANASLTGGIALQAPATYDANAFRTTLAAYQVSTVRLLGPASSFPASFISGLRSTLTVDETRVGDRPYQWSEAAVNAAARADLVVANNNLTGSVTYAAGAATQRGASLVIYDTSTDPAPFAAILNSTTVQRMGMSGGVAAFPRPDLLAEETVNKSMDYDLSKPWNIESRAIFEAAAAGNNSRRIVVSADLSADSIALSGLYAHGAGGVLAVGGDGAIASETASRYLQLEGKETQYVNLVGTKASATLRSAFMAFGAVTTQAAPAFRVTDTTLGTGNFTINAVAVTNATSYRAYDSDGVQAGTSSTPNIAISGVPRPLEVRALSSTSAVLATVQYKVTEYSTATDRPAVTISSTSGSVTHFAFLGGANYPRMIQRTSTDPYNPSAAPVEVDVAITCASSFVDSPQSTALEHHYVVTTLSAAPSACGASGTPTSSVAQVSGLTVPASAPPPMLAPNSSAQDTTGSVAQAPAASMSTTQRAISSARTSTKTSLKRSSDAARVNQVAGDGWAPIYFRYNAFIPNDKIFGGTFTGQIYRAFNFFGGDNRLYDPNGSSRYRMTTLVTFGSSHSVTYTKGVGVTHRYACNTIYGNDCVLTAEKQAPESEIDVKGITSGATTAKFTMWASATNPLVSIAPAIDAQFTFNLRSGGTTVSGIHDRMPVHELYFYVDGWNEWTPVYQSSYYDLACLSGIPGCRANVSVLL